MIKFFRRIRQTLLSENRIGKYMVYAIGEILLVVIGILIALQINNWNENRHLLRKEINMLKAFDLQFHSDLAVFEESLAFYRESEQSLDIILDHLENDLPYNDSLNAHFFVSTRIYVGSDMANNVFESLKSAGVDLISNEHIRSKIVYLYEEDDVWIQDFETKYVDFITHASEELFSSRFMDFWQGDYMDPTYRDGIMVPLDFERLKGDRDYLYFLRTQKNHMGWLIKRPIHDTRVKILALQEDIRKEIDNLENR